MNTVHSDEIDTNRLRQRRWYYRRDVRFLAVVAAVLIGYHGWGWFAGPTRIGPALLAALSRADGPVDIVVTSKFPPEQFHLGVYQELGNIRGTEGQTVRLHRVRPADVHALSRRYWIERIELARP